MQLVGPVDAPRARHGDCVIVAGAAFGRRQIVEPSRLKRCGPSTRPWGLPAKDVLCRADEALRCRVVLLEQDAGEGGVLRVAADPARDVVPEHVEEPFAAVIVVEQRRIEARRVDIDRVRPWTFDGRRGDDVVVHVLEVAVEPLDVGVDQPEQAVGKGQARRPDAAGIGIAAHVELAGAIERPLDQAPVHQVARVVDLDAGIPLEGRGGDVVVVADAADRRIRIEAAEDRVADHSTATSWRARGLSAPPMRPTD